MIERTLFVSGVYSALFREIVYLKTAMVSCKRNIAVLVWFVLAGLFTICAESNLFAQSVYLPLGTDQYHLLERAEVLSGRISDTVCLSGGAVYRSDAASLLANRMSGKGNVLTAADSRLLSGFLSENGEWPGDTDRAIKSRRPILRTFYNTPSDLFRVYKNDFFFSVNPVVYLMATEERETPKGNSTTKPLILNTRGVELRARIANKVGFYTLLSDDRENMPGFLDGWKVGGNRVVPGRDYFTATSDYNTNYFNASGYVDFAVVPDHIHVTFGNGKNFMGDGLRSLFLSDNAANTTYLKFTTNWGRFHYQNLYLELTPRFNNMNIQLPHTFATLHYLNFRAAKWLSLGLFEGTVFSDPNCYRLAYLDPVIMSRFAGQYGSVGGKEMAGLSFKAIAMRHLQLYGQFLVDDPGAKGPGSARFGFADKYGIQIGGKIMDAFTIPNLDLQGELNMVKPYTYASTDSVVNYSTYNQPLAHPLGSGFIEMIALARYQPMAKLVLTVRGTYYRRGADLTANDGNDLFKATSSMTQDAPWINGVTTSCKMVSANVSYQIFPNVFLDAGGAKREFSAGSTATLTTATGTTKGASADSWFYFGIRINAVCRAYDAWY